MGLSVFGMVWDLRLGKKGIVRLMKTILLLALCTFSLSAQSAFEVKEIPAADLQKLVAADAKLETATKALVAAQKAAEDAQKERDNIKSSALSAIGALPFEGECSSTATGHDMDQSFPMAYMRIFTRVEIRGKYALISAGSESCIGVLLSQPNSAASVDLQSAH